MPKGPLEHRSNPTEPCLECVLTCAPDNRPRSEWASAAVLHGTQCELKGEACVAPDRLRDLKELQQMVWNESLLTQSSVGQVVTSQARIFPAKVNPYLTQVCFLLASIITYLQNVTGIPFLWTPQSTDTPAEHQSRDHRSPRGYWVNCWLWTTLYLLM